MYIYMNFTVIRTVYTYVLFLSFVPYERVWIEQRGKGEHNILVGTDSFESKSCTYMYCV